MTAAKNPHTNVQNHILSYLPLELLWCNIVFKVNKGAQDKSHAVDSSISKAAQPARKGLGWVCRFFQSVNGFATTSTFSHVQRRGKTMANKVTEVLNLYAALTLSSNIYITVD